MNIERRIKNKSLLLALLEKPEGRELIAAFQEHGIELLQRLRKESDEKEIFRLQGKLEVVSAISDLKKSLLEGMKPNGILEQKRPSAGTA